MSKLRRTRRRARRTWLQRLLILVGILVTGAFWLAVYGLDLAQEKASDVQRIAISGDVLAEDVTISEARNILVIGVDSAAGLDPDDPIKIGRGETMLTDTMMVVRLDPARESAAILSLPRDLFVNVGGQQAKLNQAVVLGGGLEGGGIAQLIETIDANFGIPINNFIQVDFATFLGVVEAIDGVPYYLENPVRDKQTGLLLTDTGCQNIGAEDALRFVRARAGFQEQVDGEWRAVGFSSDLDRIQRQQDFVVAMADRAITKGARNPVTLNDLLNAVLNVVKIDTRLTPDTILSLGDQFQTFRTSTLETLTFNGLYDIAEGPGVGSLGVDINTPENQAIVAQFLGLDPAAVGEGGTGLVDPSADSAPSGLAGSSGNSSNPPTDSTAEVTLEPATGSQPTPTANQATEATDGPLDPAASPPSCG